MSCKRSYNPFLKCFLQVEGCVNLKVLAKLPRCNHRLPLKLPELCKAFASADLYFVMSAVTSLSSSVRR